MHSPSSTVCMNDLATSNRLFAGLLFKAIKMWNCIIISKISVVLLQANLTSREHQQTKYFRAFHYKHKIQIAFNTDTDNKHFKTLLFF